MDNVRRKKADYFARGESFLVKYLDWGEYLDKLLTKIDTYILKASKEKGKEFISEQEGASFFSILQKQLGLARATAKVNLETNSIKEELAEKGLDEFLKEFLEDSQEIFRQIENKKLEISTFDDFFNYVKKSTGELKKLHESKIIKYKRVNVLVKASSIKIAKMLRPVLEDLYDVYLGI